MKKIPVFIVDDQNLFRDTLSFFIQTSERFELCGAFCCAEDFFSYLQDTENKSTAVCVIELEMPRVSGFQIHETLLRNFPFVKTLLLSSHKNKALVRDIMAKKVGCYLIRNCQLFELIEAIEQVYYFDQFFSDIVLDALKWSAVVEEPAYQLINRNVSIAKLSKREQEVLTMICCQMSSIEIAKKLFVSARTIENHRNSLLKKIGVHNTVGLIYFAIKNDLYYPA